MISSIQWISLALLIVACVDDLRSQKIHNKLLMIAIPILLIARLFLEGYSSFLYIALPSVLLALALGLPLYFLKTIGAGDAKLLLVLSIAWSSTEMFWSFALSLPWAAAFGLIRVVLKGNIKTLFNNITLLFQRIKPVKENLQTFPYSIALLLGWMSFKAIGF